MPEYIQNDDAFNGRHVDQFPIHLQPYEPMQVFTRSAKHHFTQIYLHVNTLVVQPDTHTHTLLTALPLYVGRDTKIC